MTGPEHYRRAEELLIAARSWPRGSAQEQSLLAEAQVDATLAAAAANVIGYMEVSDLEAWRTVVNGDG